jgi:pteridine reductase
MAVRFASGAAMAENADRPYAFRIGESRVPMADERTNSAGDGPVALVTGSGALRVGRSVAEMLASRGYRLALHANRAIEEARQAATGMSARGTEAIALAADLADEQSVRRLMESVYAHFGRIDALVNCAAVWVPKRLEEVTAADVERHFKINTLGTFLCCQEAGLRMVGQPAGGAIVNLGDWAIVRPYTGYAAYFPSKGAIPTLTRNFAVELAARNPRVRVNAVLPGPVMLPPELPEADRREAIAGTLLKREGSPQHVAHAVAFLLENDFITGICLPVDGGRSIHPGVT